VINTTSGLFTVLSKAVLAGHDAKPVLGRYHHIKFRGRRYGQCRAVKTTTASKAVGMEGFNAGIGSGSRFRESITSCRSGRDLSTLI